MPTTSNQPRRTMLLTGASRGIGHATVIRFSSAGWRVITCSRHAFPEECPWDAGPEDHIQVDLADPEDTLRAVAEIRKRLEGGELHALVNNAAISPKGADGARLGTMDTELATWKHVFRVNFFAPIMMARAVSSWSARSTWMWSSGPASHGQSSGKAWREQVMTRQPAAAKRLTVAWPMPRLAPVRSSVRRDWFEVGAVCMMTPYG